MIWNWLLLCLPIVAVVMVLVALSIVDRIYPLTHKDGGQK
jgi:hypothetical protein